MRKIVSGMVGAIAAMAMASAAQAQIGCYVGVSGGLTNWDSNTTLTSPLIPTASLGFDNIGATGKMLGLGAGCDAKIDRLVVGVFGDWDKYSDMSTNVALSLGGLSAGAKMSMDQSWTLGGRIGYNVAPSTLVYGLLGWTNVSTSDLVVSTNIPGINAIGANSDLSGYTIGGGFETALGRGWALKLEYRYTKLDVKDIPITFGGVNVANANVDSDMNSVRLGLAYHFGGADRAPIEPLK